MSGGGWETGDQGEDDVSQSKIRYEQQWKSPTWTLKKKSQIFNWSFDCFTYSDIQCDWEDEDDKVEDSNDESRIVGERKQFIFIVLQSSEVFNIFNKFIQWHIHNWDSNSTVHQADSSLYIASSAKFVFVFN